MAEQMVSFPNRQSQVHKHGIKLSDWVINFPDFYSPYATFSGPLFGLGQHISLLHPGNPWKCPYCLSPAMA